MTCKHIIENGASFLPLEVLAAVSIENWTIEVLARTLPTSKDEDHVPACQTLFSRPNSFQSLERENLAATVAHVEAGYIIALRSDILPTSVQLNNLINPCDRIHCLTYPWTHSVSAGAGAGATQIALSPDLDAQLPIFSSGSLAFPPCLDFRGRAKGVYTHQGRLDASTGGSPLFWFSTSTTDRVTRLSSLTVALKFIGIHSEGPEERELLSSVSSSNTGAGPTVASNVSFCLKSELLKQFYELFVDLKLS